jgi:hypothetical protein
MKYLKYVGLAFLGIIIIFVIIVKVGVFNYLLGLPPEEITNFNTILTAINSTIALLTFFVLIVYTGFTGELITADFKPKLYVVGKIEDSGNLWDKSVMWDVLEDGSSNSLKGPGFVYISADKKWVLEVHNNGHSPAKNVEVSYTVTAYKHEIVFGIDRADIKDFYPVKYAEKKQTINIDYIPPNSSQTFTIFFMCQFPKADLTIEILKCDERLFIGKATRISTFFNEEFHHLVDSPHLLRMLGLID